MTAGSKNAFILAFVPVVFVMLLFASVTAHAADGSNAYGAAFPDYNSAKEVNVVDDCKADPSGEKDSADAIQKALNVGRDEASDSERVVVTVPEGTYKISKTLNIYSNTQLILDAKAKIVKDFQLGCMLKNTMHDSADGGYNGDRNILIEGGMWDGNTAQYSGMSTFSNIRIAHANNIIFRNVTILNNKNGHHIEAGGVRGMTIEGCYFSGYTGNLQKEAIQLDVMNSEELFVDYPPFDDTPCDNIIIRNCTFKDIPRGIGSHSAVIGRYYTNITIINNTFDNISDICMVLYNYKHCTISGNSIMRCGAGITFNYMSDESFRHYFAPTDGVDAAKGRIDPDADTIIENNTIETVKTAQRTVCFAIKLYGADIADNTSDYPAFNYKLGDIRISSNKITTADRAVWATNAYSVSVRSNEIKTSKDQNETELALFSWCSNCTFKSNDVKASNDVGLRSANSSGMSVEENTFSDCAKSGIVFENTADSAIEKNGVDSCPGAVSITSGTRSLKCSKNTIKNFGETGISVDSSGEGKDIKLTANDLSSGGIGISCTNDGKCYVSRNSFEAVSDKVFADSAGLVSIARVKNFCAEEVTENRIKLTWDAVGEADGINVYRKRAGGGFELIASLESGAAYSDEKLYSGTNYFYRVVPFLYAGDETAENTPSDDIRTRTKLNIETAYIECVSEAGFTGRKIEPQVRVVVNNVELTQGVDYDVSYSDNIFVGTASVSAVGKGNYSGILKYEFEITITGKRLNETASKQKARSRIFAAAEKTHYNVTLLPPKTTAFADSDELIPPARRSIDAITLGIPQERVTSFGLWTGMGYTEINSRIF